MKKEYGGRTQRQFRDQCDVVKMTKRFKDAGKAALGGSNQELHFGNVDLDFDYVTANQRVADVKMLFEQFPAKVRDMFQNDALRCVQFVIDPQNKETCQSLGLLPKEKPVNRPTPVEMPAVPKTPDVPPTAAVGG